MWDASESCKTDINTEQWTVNKKDQKGKYQGITSPPPSHEATPVAWPLKSKLTTKQQQGTWCIHMWVQFILINFSKYEIYKLAYYVTCD